MHYGVIHALHQPIAPAEEVFLYMAKGVITPKLEPELITRGTRDGVWLHTRERGSIPPLLIQASLMVRHNEDEVQFLDTMSSLVKAF